MTGLADDLGFSANYRLEVSPEFPGTGRWRCPAYGFDQSGVATDFLATGADIVIQVETTDGTECAASFGGGMLAGRSGVYGTPNPDALLVHCDGTAHLLDVRHPERGTTVLSLQATQVVPAPDHDIFLVASYASITAIGAADVAWKSKRLCWDDLRIVGVSTTEIICTGEFMPTSEFALDPATGRHVRGAAFTGPGGQ